MVCTPLIQLREEQVGYGPDPVLRDLDLSIAAGEKVALIGESGVGKTTLLKRLYSLVCEHAALCPQQLGLVPELSVYHNIFMGRLDQHGFWYNLLNLVRPRRRDREAIFNLAAELGLEPQLDSSVDQLSGGQRQRVALGRALYRASPIFIGDEPVSAVDEFQAERLLALINRRHETVVVALHDQAAALQHFDRLIGLRDGKIVLDAPSAELSLADLARVYEQ
ncbi:ATP-binding cassette domain-containing protein [Motiliproteus sp. SC1-56]|uniref:ATP-binding cassette domain-containing protein n=1 Tax=Motiliproteus sp. SC1-56 TaxID=2799565 RepID=UPI001A8ED80E|nr:ATP-binding cassette domain-containing protein [Motiliproteus sp. SC1-56]